MHVQHANVNRQNKGKLDTEELIPGPEVWSQLNVYSTGKTAGMDPSH